MQTLAQFVWLINTPWDYFKMVKMLTSKETAISIKDSECSLIKK